MAAGIRYQTYRKFGRNDSIGAAFVPVVPDRSVTGFLPTAAAATTIVSGNAADTVAGTGAQSVEVQGVDGNGIYVHETVVLTGLTPVGLNTDFLFINRQFVVAAGSNRNNVGDIDVKHGATIINSIPAGTGRSQSAAFFIDTAGLGIALHQIRAYSIGANNAHVSVRLWSRDFASGVDRLVGLAAMHADNAPYILVKPTPTVNVSPGTWLWLEALVTVGIGEVTADIDMTFN